MAIKGQNLRLFVEGKCIAAATSCTIHVTAQTEDATTKDSDGDWVENQCVGLGWDASVDALVMANRELGYLPYGGVNTSINGQSYFILASVRPITLKTGDKLHVNADAAGAVYALAILNGTKSTVLATSTGNQSVVYTAVADVTVYVALKGGFSGEGAVHASIEENGANYLDDMLSFFADTLVDVTVDVTTGDLNRESDEQLYTGQARLTDLSINAANRQNGTYTAQLTGFGKLEQAEDDD